jgi:hypothetical protein
MLSISRVGSVVVFLAATSVGACFAADLPKEGSYDIKTCFTRNSTRIDYAPTHYAYSYEETGTSLSNPPGGLFDNDVVRCVGMSASFDGKRKGSSVCEGVATDGARRLTYFWIDSDGKPNREAVSGTGKYDGMVTTTGTIQAVGPTPVIKTGTAQLCNHQTGTYKLK